MTRLMGDPAHDYNMNGYYIVPDMRIPHDLLDRARKRFSCVLRGEYESGMAPWRHWNRGEADKLQKIDQVHLTDTALFELATHPAIGEWAARVLGAKHIQVWATQLFYKPPGSGEQGHIGWHTDQDNWRFWQGEVFTAWLPLTPIQKASGPLCFARGSHQWPNLEFRGDGYGHDLSRQRREIEHEIAMPMQEVQALLPAGGLSFHHSRTWHYSGTNTSTEPRCSLAINLRTEHSNILENEEHYGYGAYLDDPLICPVIYSAAH
ncbi:MAG: phytanoyl-CoA dioxygenase family protein [Gammaproteobacteria bacterium]